MDNLLVNYGSSDEEEEERQPKAPAISSLTTPNFSEGISKTSSSIFSSLPPPKSSSTSLFNSLPPPKSNLPKPPQTLPNLDDQEHDGEEVKVGQQKQHQKNLNLESASEFSKKISKPPSLFSSLPPPKTHQSDSQAPQSSPIFSSLPPPKLPHSDSQTPLDHSSSSNSNTKRVVQFKLPINPFSMKSSKVDDEEDDDEEEEEKARKRSKEFTQTPTVKSFLSSIPAPKNSVTLGALPSALVSGRRSILEADVPASNYNPVATEKEVRANSNVENYESQWVDRSASNSLGTAGDQSEFVVAAGGDPSNWVSAGESYVNNDTHGGYGDYGNYGHYESNWVDGSATTATSDVSRIIEHAMKVPGKRGRIEVPQEIIEVKQDELIKNRPREDQVKLTGIAFGPSYQPVSTKGKPSKLHKRKHQIGSLLYDMKQKEMELAERRAKGFLTKAETQAKYGW